MNAEQEQIKNRALALALEPAKQMIGPIFDALVTSTIIPNNILPESVFVEHFLPFFAGKRSFDDVPQAYNDWVSIAGGAYREVNIIDINNNVLFSVPKMLNTASIDAAAYSRSIKSILASKDQRDAAGHRDPEIDYDEMRSNLINKMHTVEVNEADTDKWNFIFDKYGVVVGTALNSAAILTSDDNAPLIYD